MSSAGQIVGGIVGAVIGFYVGGPAGALKGAWLGMTVGGLIDPPKGPTIRGPRLDDLSVQTATYGAFIPRVYGTVGIHGNVFWVQGDSLIENKVVTESGKGGSSQTTETFEYFATFAVGLADCSDNSPIAGVRRIWIGGQLWYDAGASDTESVIATAEAAPKFTLYTGTDTQLADPLMQADKGAANVPAYRGLCYIVFDNLPLGNYSNSLMGAQVKVELIQDGSAAAAATTSLAEIGTNPNSNSLAAAGNYIYVTAYDQLQTFNVAVPGSPFLSAAHVFDPVTNAYLLAADGANLYVDTRIGGYSKLNLFDLGDPSNPGFAGNVDVGSYTQYPVALSACNNRAYLVIDIDATRMLDIYEGLVKIISVSAAAVNQVYATQDYLFTLKEGSDLFEVRSLSADVIGSLTLTIGAGAQIRQNGNYVYVTTYPASLYVIDIATPTAPALIATIALAGEPRSLTVSGNTLVISEATSGNNLQTFDITAPAAPTLLYSYVTGSAALDGTAIGNYAFVLFGTDVLRSYFFTGKIITSNQVALSAIVSAECLKSKLLTAADIDVTELTDTVRGYRVGALGAIRAGLDPLRAAWPFDVVQAGYDIKFKKRGSASVAIITAGELDAHAAGDSPGVSVTDMREMDLILPYKVGVKYLDATREYDLNEQYAERLNTDAVNEHAIDLPIVFTASEAAGKAETLLYLYWLERYDVMLTLPPSYAHLEPGDVITVEATFATYELRLTSAHHLPDGRVECRAKYNSASIYTPAAQGSEGLSVGATLSLAGPTAYVLLDIPLLRDDDDTAGFPVAMTGYLSGWPGGVLFRSEDGGETWLDLAGFVSPGTVMGYATNSLAAHGGTAYDFASTLTVKLFQGTLASITEAQLFAAQNWFAYGADGRWEIIAAKTATLQGDGSYILQDFLRGQLGTEWATGLHATNDSIVRLSADDLEFISVNASTIGGERKYRGITAGKTLDSDGNRAFTYNGVNLECLSPVHATGDRHPTTNDWTLTWVRRSRFSGWRDYVDATLGETAESYEVDIFSSSAYTTVLRTLTSATQTVAYTSANQVTDFGSNQATLYLKIYQLSATVGRGYPLTVAITR